jgi:hypothetical protein
MGARDDFELKEADRPVHQGVRCSMADNKHSEHHHHHPDTGPHPPHEQQKPYWQRAHMDWKFWVGVVAIAVAIVIYVVTLDLSTAPR